MELCCGSDEAPILHPPSLSVYARAHIVMRLDFNIHSTPKKTKKQVMKQYEQSRRVNEAQEKIKRLRAPLGTMMITDFAISFPQPGMKRKSRLVIKTVQIPSPVQATPVPSWTSVSLLLPKQRRLHQLC